MSGTRVPGSVPEVPGQGPGAAPRVIELRIHGVGGEGPHTTLGVPKAGHSGRSLFALRWGGSKSGFYRRQPWPPRPWRDEVAVEAYNWAGLTTRARSAGLWPLLLPFTLANVAGFMEASSRNEGLEPVMRRLVGLVAWSVTVTWAVWAAGAVVRVGVSGAAGYVLVGAVLVVLAGIARHSTAASEARRPPKELLGGTGDDYSLADARMWDFLPWARRQQWRHLALAAVAAVAVLRLEAARFDDVLTVVVVSQVLLLVVLGVTSALDRVQLGWGVVRAGIGPWGASAVAVGMSHGGWSAVMEVGRWFGLAQGAADQTERAVFLASAAGAAITALVAGVIAAWLLLRPEKVTDVSPPDGERMLRRIGRARSVARALGRVGPALLASGGLFFVVTATDVAGPALLGWWDPDASLLAGWRTLEVVVEWAGRATVVALLLAILIMLAARRSTGVATTVGILWDVLAFLPRWHHPLAVPSYAERAVPDLLDYLLAARRDGVRFVVSAHSQGSVLAVAALAPLPPADDATTVSDVALVTYGSPLTDLHARFFPYWFGSSELVPRLAERLHSWHNFYRRTDYVGQRIDGVPGHECHDPATEADVDDTDPGLLFDDEQPRQPWGRLLRHSGYRREPSVRAHVEAEVEALLSR